MSKEKAENQVRNALYEQILTRRRFLTLTGAGLVAYGSLVPSLADAKRKKKHRKKHHVQVVADQAPVYSGPGNVGYRILQQLARGTSVIATGTYGDFVRVEIPNGKLVMGFVLAMDLAPIPPGVMLLGIKDVPWEERDIVLSSDPLTLQDDDYPQEFAKQGATRNYGLPGSNLVAERDLRLRISLDADLRQTGTGSYVSFDFMNGAEILERTDGKQRWAAVTKNSAGWGCGYFDDGSFQYFSDLHTNVDGSADVVVEIPSNGQQAIVTQAGGSSSHTLSDPLYALGKSAGVEILLPPHGSLTIKSFSVEVAPTGKREQLLESLRGAAQPHGVVIGVNGVGSYQCGDPSYQDLLAGQFNALNIDADTWMNAVRSGPTQYTFIEPDVMTNFALQNGMKVRGYLLPTGSTPEDLPDWLTNPANSRDDILAIVRDHIHTVTERYRGKVSEWGVLGETIISWANSGQPDFYKANFWLSRVGMDFIDLAFQWTREADPDAKLLYSFTENEGLNPQSDFVYQHIKDLKSRGIPVDIVGMEGHLGALKPPNKQDVVANMRRLKALGVEVEIGEMDVNVYGLTGTEDQKLQAQAQIYTDMLSALLESGAGTNFYVMNLFDGNEWLDSMPTSYLQGAYGVPGAEAPTLFDKNFAPKPAYYALLDVLKNPPAVVA